jgi:hypothetical protein
MKYQLCPKCNGQGSVSKPPWLPGDVDRWSCSETFQEGLKTSFVCNVCDGAKILLVPGKEKNNGR